MTNEDRNDWAKKFLHPDDVDELTFKTDRFIAFESPGVSMHLDLSINEAIRLCRSWDDAQAGNKFQQKQFLNAMNGAMEHIGKCLAEMDIDYEEEFIDDDYEQYGE